MTIKPNLIAAMAIALILSASPAFAVTTINNLHTRPVDQIAADLNVAPERFVACFTEVRPSAPGTKPTQAREMSNKAILLPCLQAANSTITNDLLDRVMDKYRGVHIAPTAD